MEGLIGMSMYLNDPMHLLRRIHPRTIEKWRKHQYIFEVIGTDKVYKMDDILPIHHKTRNTTQTVSLVHTTINKNGIQRILTME